MNRPFTSRLVTGGPLWSISYRPARPLTRWRTFSSETTTGAGAQPPSGLSKAGSTGVNIMRGLSGLLSSSLNGARSSGPRINDRILDESDSGRPDETALASSDSEPYHFHIYSHKHNTHVTVTSPDRSPLISLSCGNLGFRKSNRKHYDSAYQLGAYVIDKLHQKGLHRNIHALEVILRGFGPGREAVTKVLLGSEGRLLRPKIVRVADSTRLKFGGTRSKKPRRLG